ncbi:hypothetical protein NE237_031364 [Protea cynaroides]|uniref:Uncharacterized protein n=1 Tax=Protea cynaroides TaxID=273540 RepID=A0A9Q0L121_9MAGN|nr:hypothetical protein NE237_031364 [Protea cynaroides]
MAKWVRSEVLEMEVSELASSSDGIWMDCKEYQFSGVRGRYLWTLKLLINSSDHGGVWVDSLVRTIPQTPLLGGFIALNLAPSETSGPANDRISSVLLGVSLFCVAVHVDSVLHPYSPLFSMSQHANSLCDIVARINSLEAKCARVELRWEIAEDALARERDREKDQNGALREEAWRYRQRMMTLEGEQAKHLSEKTKLSIEFFVLCDFVWAKIPNIDFFDFQGAPSSPSSFGV